jgi:hypothetical protein
VRKQVKRTRVHRVRFTESRLVFHDGKAGHYKGAEIELDWWDQSVGRYVRRAIWVSRERGEQFAAEVT